jgi:uncharacterized membrane protein (UPF0127 family)
MKTVDIKNLSNPFPNILNAKYCDQFFARFKGLMFDNKLGVHEGLILVDRSESILNSSIHMFFMEYDIAAIWLDHELKVVDVKLAKKWFPYYAPSYPAQFVIEAHTNWIDSFHIGDHLTFSYD